MTQQYRQAKKWTLPGTKAQNTKPMTETIPTEPPVQKAPAVDGFPEEATSEGGTPESHTVLLYGAPKVGKSTWASKAPDAVFIDCEDGLKFIHARKIKVVDYESLIKAVKLLKANHEKFSTIIVDTIDVAFRYVVDYVCRKNSVQWIGDVGDGYGKGSGLANNEMTRILLDLKSLRKGLILLSHAQQINVKLKTGKDTKTVPTMPPKLREVVLGQVNHILYAEVEESMGPDKAMKQERVIHGTPTSFYEAGGHLKLPETLPLDYEAFRAAVIQGAKEQGVSA